MKINKVDLFRKYLDLLMVEYVDPCTGEHVCHGMSPTTTLIPINGVPCPVVYPVIYNATSYSTEALLLGAVQTTYPGFTITYNNTTCEFSFTGTSTPPTTIELSTVVPPSTIVPISGVSCPVTYPVNYNGNSYASESALLSAVQAVYPTFIITYNNVSCEFTFVGTDTPPTSINLSHLSGTPVPVLGRGCPIQYPAYYRNDLISDETDLITSVSFIYSLEGFTVVYDAPSCTFYFTGPGTPPTNITLYTPVAVTSTPNNCGNLYTMGSPITYNGNSYPSKAAFIAAVQSDYPAFTVLDGGDGTFHFLGQGVPPVSIPTVFTNYSVTNTRFGTFILNWSLVGTTITGNFIWTGVSGTINWILHDVVVHSSGTTSPGVLTNFSTTITNPSGSNGLLQLTANCPSGQIVSCIAYLP